MSITITDSVTPTFTAVGPYCSGATISALPTTSNNSISGSWSPVLDNTTTKTYTFTPTVLSTPNCARTATMSITINICTSCSATLSSASGTNNQTKCINSPLTDITYSTSVATGISNNGIDGANGLPAGVSASWSANTITISGTPTVAGDFNYSIQLIGGSCSGELISGTIKINDKTVPTFVPLASICKGDAISPLPTTSTNGITGTWSPALDNTATKSYTFTPTAGQCATTQTLNIVVNNPPIVSVNDITTCNGKSTILTATPVIGGGNYKWSTGETTQSITVSPSATQKYYAIYSLAPDFCPSDTTFSTVTVNQQTKPTFVAVSPVCYGSLMTALPLISTNGIHGSWSPVLNNNLSTKYVFTPDLVECADTASLTIIVNSKPNVAFSSSLYPSSCSGQDGEIVISGMQLNVPYSLNYQKNNTPVSINKTSDGFGKIKISNLGSGDYTNINVVLSGCTSNTIIGPITLADPTPPVANANGTQEICEGQTLKLTSDFPGNGATYSWSGPNGFNASTQNATVSLSATQSMSGTYSVVQSYLGCTGTVSTVDIVVTPMPITGVLSGSNTICSGVNTTYTSTVSGGKWTSTNPAVASVNANTGVITTFIPGNADITYTVKGSGGCSDVSDSKAIVVSEDYKINLTSVIKSDTQTVCINAAIDPIEYTITNAIGVNAKNLPLGVNATVLGNKITISGTPTQKGTFDYIVKATGGCGKDSVVGQIVVSDILTPVVSITSSDADNIICAGTSVTFTAHPVNGGSNPTYQWKLNGVDISAEQKSFYTKSTLNDGDKVTVQLTSNSACASPLTAISNEITTSIGNSVAPSFNTKASICEGEIYSLPNTSIEGAEGTWLPLMNITKTTTYEFTPKVVGCYSKATFTLIVNPLPDVKTTIGTSTVCNNTATDIKLSSSVTGTTFTWTATESSNVTGANAGNGTTIAHVLKLADNIVGTVDYLITPKSGICTGSPSTLSLKVNPNVTPSVLIEVTSNNTLNATKDTVTLCPDDNLQFKAISINGGTNPIFEWKINNVDDGINLDQYRPSKTNDKDVIWVNMTSNQLCASPVKVTSNRIHAVVREDPMKASGSPALSCNMNDGSIQLKGNGTGDVKWSIGNVIKDSLNVTISTVPNKPFVIRNLIPGAYKIDFDNHTCVYHYKASVGQPTLPDPPSAIILSKPTPICTGDSVQLTVQFDQDTPSSYIWIKNDIDTLPGKGQSIWVKEAAKYGASIVMSGCVSDLLDTNITFIGKPDKLAVSTVTQPSCTIDNGSVKLTNLPFGNWSVSTTPSLGSSITGTVNTVILNNLAPSTTYAIKVKSSTGCFSDTILLKISAKKTPPTAPKLTNIQQPTCTTSTGSVLLSSLPIGNWTMTSTPATKVYSGSSSTQLVKDLPSGITYTFMVVDENGCSSTSSQIATIDPYFGKPGNPSLPSTKTFCAESKETVSSIIPSSQSYTWYKDATGSSTYTGNELLIDNQDYYVSQTLNKCESDRVRVVVNLDNGPNLKSYTPFTFCSVSNPTVATLIKQLNIPTGTVSIFDGIQGGSNLDKSDLLNSKKYYYNVSNGACSNVNRQEISVIMNDGTLPNLTTTTPTICVFNKMMYSDLSKELGAVNGLIWYSNQVGGTAFTASDLITYPPMNQTFYVAYKPTQSTACESKNRTKVSLTFVLPPSDISLKDNFYEPCTGSKETVANLPTSPYTSNTIDWFSDPTSVKPLKATDPLYSTNYYASSVNVDPVSGKKCYSKTKALVDVHLYEVAFIAHSESSICDQNTGVLTIFDKEINGHGPFTFSVKDSKGFEVGNTYKTSKLSEGEYTITVTDKNNCKQTQTEKIGCTVNDIPHVLTPDGDGKNDTWIIRYHENYPTVQVTVFNRWGSKVYTSEIPYMDNWDGKPSTDIQSLGHDYLPSGTYFYLIDKGNGDAVESGYVELVK